MFLKDLLGLPPNRELEFCIDLLPVTALIFIPLYRIVVAKLKELKIELHDLYDKGFIRSSVSP